MKYLLILGLALSTFGFARPLNSPEKAGAVKNILQETVFEISGVNGIGVTACNPRTGGKSLPGADFVYCVTIFTATEEAFENVSMIYPPKTKVGGIFVAVENIGEIVPAPNGSGGI